jgi:hypothetical protein
MRKAAMASSVRPNPCRRTPAELAGRLQELDRIDAAVSRASVPLPFSDQLYDLRAHINLVRRRLQLMPQT